MSSVKFSTLFAFLSIILIVELPLSQSFLFGGLGGGGDSKGCCCCCPQPCAPPPPPTPCGSPCCCCNPCGGAPPPPPVPAPSCGGIYLRVNLYPNYFSLFRRMWGWLLWFICANNCKLWMWLWVWKIRRN